MAYQRERDQFIAQVTREGLPLYIAERLLRAATTIQRYAELACSSEAADRDRVPCPAYRHFSNTKTRKGPCLCDYNGQHHDVPRIAVQEWRVTERLKSAMPAGWDLRAQGDPRGYTLRVIPPSYADRNKGRDRHNVDTIGVPARDTRLRF